MKKYELTSETTIVAGKKLFRIKALINFDDVTVGDLGGFIEKEENLSHKGYAWIEDNACVLDNACVYGNARVCDNARVCGNAVVCGDARVYDTARIYDNVEVFDNARVCGDAVVYDNARIYDKAGVYGTARIYDNVEVFDKARVCGNARVYDNVEVFDKARVCGNARVCGDAMIKKVTDIITISPIGSRNDTTTFFKNENGSINVICGCFKGSIDEFVNAVKETHHGTVYEKQYNLAIEMAKTIIL